VKTILHHHSYDHPLTRLDARVKLLCAVTLLVMVLSYQGITFPLLMAGLCIGLCLNLGVRLRLLAIRFSQPLFIAGMVLLLKLFASGQSPLFSWSLPGVTITGYSDGLQEGLLIVGRIFGAVSVVSLVGFSTSFTDLMAALAWLRVPRGVIEVALFAWRYLFVLFDDAMVVYHSQKNRLGYAGYRRGLSSFGTLTGAMVIKVFDNSQTITTAMVQRGYDGTMPLVRQKPFRLWDVVWALSVVLGLGVVWSF